MRVIAGRLKGRRLAAPSWEGLRPTSDRLRETLFNVLAPRISRATVLDGFAGTGAVGIEALSRGAAHVTFVESDRRAVALIERNLASCRVADAYTMIQSTFEAAADALGTALFELVLLDPPYAVDRLEEIVTAGAARLTEWGWLVLEHDSRRAVPERVGGVERVRCVRAGDSALSIYRRSALPGPDARAAHPGEGPSPARRPGRRRDVPPDRSSNRRRAT